MEKIKILKINKIEKKSIEGLNGYYYAMTIVSDYDGLEREVFMGFRADGTEIYANDYNNVQFHFVDKKIDIKQCKSGGEYKVNAVKMKCPEMVASIIVQTQPHQD